MIQRDEEKKEEEAFRVAMMEKFAEDDRIDMLNAQARARLIWHIDGGEFKAGDIGCAPSKGGYTTAAHAIST